MSELCAVCGQMVDAGDIRTITSTDPVDGQEYDDSVCFECVKPQLENDDTKRSKRTKLIASSYELREDIKPHITKEHGWWGVYYNFEVALGVSNGEIASKFCRKLNSTKSKEL